MAQTKLDSADLSLVSSLQVGALTNNGTAQSPTAWLGGYSTVAQYRLLINHSGSGMLGIGSDGAGAMTLGRAADSLGTPQSEYARFDGNGNLLVGVTSGTCNKISKNLICDVGNMAVELGGQNQPGVAIYATTGAYGNAANTSVRMGKDAVTNRSINAAGTINASGADYAEYMTKAEACGTIAKGAIVGIDIDGHVTDKWAAAVSFLIKSTAPSYVGGDAWGSAEALGMARPIEPVLELPAYTGAADPGLRPEAPEPADLVDVADKALEQVDPATIDAELLAYDQALAAYQADQLAHADAIATALKEFNNITMPAYQAELATFEALLEAARQRVDRMAYCGQVPVNVTGGKPGQYVVPIAAGDGIAGQLVDAAAVTFDQYRRAVGIVQNILPDGRANVRVKPV